MEELLAHVERFDEGVDRRFLVELELIHDNCEPREWERELRKFAKAHGLKIPKASPSPSPSPSPLKMYLKRAFKG